MRDIKEASVRRAEIMETAFTLFIEKGYLNTTTQDIIEKAAISRGLLYYHFKNKEDILYCIIENYSKPLLEKLKRISYAKDKSAVEKIKEFFLSTIIAPEDVTNEMIQLQSAVDLEQNQYLMDKFSHNFIDKLTDYFANILEQGIAEKSFKVDYPFETAYFLITSYVFASNSLSLHSETDGKAHFEAFKFILTSVLKSDALFD